MKNPLLKFPNLPAFLPAEIRDDSTIKTSAWVCTIALGGFFLWSAFAPLAEGVTAFGKITVENNRKVIQHLEGGIIRNLMVTEGDHVAAGQPLMILESIAPLAARDQVAKELAGHHMSIDRLNALIAGSDELIFSSALPVEIDESAKREIGMQQLELFTQQKETLSADIQLLESRLQNLRATANLRDQQIRSNQRALAVIREELQLQRELLQEQLARAEQVSRLELDEAQLEAAIARLSVEQKDAQAAAVEAENQMSQTRAHFQETITTELLEIRAELHSAKERLNAAQDILNRTTINAPQSGEVLNLKFSTKGGVVRPGEPIMEIVPENSDLIATVQVRPVDRESIYKDLDVETRLSGLKSWRAPRLKGQVIGISADLKTAPDGEQDYYEARILINEEELQEIETKVTPGMPIEAFIYSGHTRTLLEYLFEPLTASLSRGMRAQ